MRFLIAFLLLPGLALAHEDHAPLPTKGATVKGDRLMLSASASQAIGLQTAKVELAEVRRTVHAVGSVELPWTQQAYVTTLIAGRVEQVLVKPGETVAAGQELARVNGMELENLQLAMLQAATEKSLASRMLDRQVAAGEGIAGKVLLQTRTEVQQQSARFNAAWQTLRAVGLTKDALKRVSKSGETVRSLSIVSPIDGVVLMADVRVGQIVQPTEHLYHVVDSSRVWIVAKVLEADAGRMKRGLPVEVTFAMLPGEKFRAPIDHVELRLNKDRTLSVKAWLDNSRGTLKAGMFGQVEIQLANDKAVVCPKEALIRDGLASFALVERSAGNYVRKPVVVAALRGQAAEIEDGLFPGDKVVTVGSHELAALFVGRVDKQPLSDGQAYFEGTTVAQGQVELPTDQKTFACAPIEGRIQRILVEHGQAVKKGAVLAELESLPFKTLQLDLLQTITNLRLANLNLERVQALSQSDSVARKDVWQLQTQRDTYQQAVASLRRKLALVGLSEAEITAIEQTDIADSPPELTSVLPIRAPADGLIAEFDLIPGQVVSLQCRLFELHNPTAVWVQAFLFEQDAVRVSAGQAVQVSLVSDPNFRAIGKVERLNPVLLAGNRALSIWTEIDNPNLQLKEGMAAIVTIDTSKSAPIAGH